MKVGEQPRWGVGSLVGLALICLALVVTVALPSHAATLDHTCAVAGDLQAAVDSAAPGDTVSVAAGTCTFAASGLVIGKDLTLSGAGAGVTILDGTGASGSSVVTVASNTRVMFDNLTITGGSGATGGGVNIDGAITHVTQVQFSAVTIEGNTATGTGGGIHAENSDVTITDSLIRNNSADVGGGLFLDSSVLSGALVVTDSTFSSNSAADDGGAIYFFGVPTGALNSVSGSSVLDNEAGSDGGGIWYRTGPFEVSGSTVQGNTAAHYGGGVFAKTDGLRMIAGTSVVGNVADEGGGVFAERHADLTDVIVEGNSAGGDGGGVRSRFDSVAITRSELLGNSAGGSGGGLSGGATFVDGLIAGNDADTGGGLAVPPGRAVMVTGSTISGNVAVGKGGGIDVDPAADLDLRNSTVSANSATDPAGAGGGIWSAGTSVVDHATVTENGAAFVGGIHNEPGASLFLAASIVAGNTHTSAGDADCTAPTITSGGDNVFGDCLPAGGSNDIAGLPVLLGPLGDNGGYTPTHSLGVGSPAIDHVGAPCSVAVDQRGVGRPGGPECDAGAFEVVFCAGLVTTHVGTPGDDSLIGTVGDDVFLALGGDDVIRARSGNDHICAGDGDDRLYGGPGDDYLDGEDGADVAAYTGSPSSVDVDLGSGTSSGGHGTDTLVSIEGVRGSSHGDVLRGDGAANALFGAGGDDLIIGEGGDDQLHGASGQDTVTYAGAAGAVDVNLRARTATGEGSDTLQSFEIVIGSPFDDTLRGNALDNSLFGGAGDDRLIGLNGADSLSGGPGDDHLNGRAGSDELIGGSGVDEASFINAPLRVTVNLLAGTATGDGADLLTSVENVRGSNRDDVLTGNAMPNLLRGGGGDDLLLGLAGNDTLIGNAGDDRALGGEGVDICLAETESTCES